MKIFNSCDLLCATFQTKAILIIISLILAFVVNSTASESGYVCPIAGERSVYQFYLGVDNVELKEVGRIDTPGSYLSCIALRPGTKKIYSFVLNRMGAIEIGDENHPDIIFPEISYFEDYVVFSSDGKFLYVCCSLEAGGSCGLIINPDDGVVIGKIDGKTRDIGRAIFSDDDKEILFWQQRAVKSYNIETGEITTKYSFIDNQNVQYYKGIVEANNGFYIYTSPDSCNSLTSLFFVTPSSHIEQDQVYGEPLPGNGPDVGWFYYDRGGEMVNIRMLNAEGKMVPFSEGKSPRMFIASFGELFGRDKIRIKTTFEHEGLHPELPVAMEGSEDLYAYPKFDNGYVSPSGKYCVFVYGGGNRNRGYLAIRSNETGMWSKLLPIGSEKAIGASNVVFMNDNDKVKN